MKSFVGTGVALVTPFKKDFSVDTEALKRIVNHVTEGGVEYLVVLGTTGEPATLTKDEKELVINTIVEANNGRLPLVLGVGSNNTADVVAELQTRDFTHFSAILSVSPYYNKPTQEGIYQHFSAIVKVSPLPVILEHLRVSRGLSNSVKQGFSQFFYRLGERFAIDWAYPRWRQL
jgi:4-hydroxy-tetrahydrodipicolinate synthase